MKTSLFAAALLLVVPMAVTGMAHAKPPAAPHYDCSKAGNKNKAACKTAAAASASSSTPKVAAAQTPKAKNFDCTKAGNKNKVQCKSTAVATAAPPAQTKPQTLPINARPPKATPAASVAKTATATAPAGSAPAGATAQCKDGTYSMSKHHSGSCSHHGGVAKFLA